LPAWSRPDPAVPADHRLDPGLDVMVTESFPNGWARIVCSNTWSGWVDGRLLVPVQGGAATATPTTLVGQVGPAAVRRRLGVAVELALVAVLGVAAWLVASSLAPISLRIVLIGDTGPWLVGLGVAAAAAAVKVLRGQR